jgi:hypothetical protein
VITDKEAVVLLPGSNLFLHGTLAQIDKTMTLGAVEPVAVSSILFSVAVVALRYMTVTAQDEGVDIPLLLKVVKAPIDSRLVTGNVWMFDQVVGSQRLGSFLENGKEGSARFGHR